MKKYTIFLPITLLMISVISCNNTVKSNYSNQTNAKVKTTTYTASNHPGKKIMEAKCYVCHSPSANHDNRIAPPMVAIKSHYLDDETSKEEFISSVWNFVKKPSRDKTKMRGAVKRFGVMPYQPFSEEDIKLISDYMFDFKIEEPEWFKEHIEEEGNSKMKYRNGAN